MCGVERSFNFLQTCNVIKFTAFENLLPSTIATGTLLTLSKLMEYLLECLKFDAILYLFVVGFTCS